ncbi:MAG: T9SS type A sorting domain-containing protein [Bacteroidota bacterium]
MVYSYATRCVSKAAVAEHLSVGCLFGACTTLSTANKMVIESDLNTSNTLTAYPNPISKQTRVSFKLARYEARVSLDLYDVKGAKIKTIYSRGAKGNTTYSFIVDGKSIAAGSYFFRLAARNKLKIYKIM